MSKSNNSVLFWIISIAVIAITVGLVFAAGGNTAPDSDATLIAEVTNDDWIKGNPDADIVFVEYGDFECPACGNYFPLVDQLSKEFGNHVAFVYRHFPLSQHIHAELAGRASEAAGMQGKFWEMHDMLYEKQQAWSVENDPTATFRGYAEEIGLDLEQYDKDIESSAAEKALDDDKDGGLESGVRSTPSFFINGELIQNPRTYEEFRQLIIAAMEGKETPEPAEATP